LLAHGPVARVVADAKAPDIRAAFTSLIQGGATVEPGEAA